jgi:hypothetical protein
MHLWKEEEQGYAKCCQPGKLSHTSVKSLSDDIEPPFTAFSLWQTLNPFTQSGVTFVILLLEK